MESVARLMVAGFELMEAEGRVLRQQLVRIGLALALGIMIIVLALAGMGFVLYGLFYFLAGPLGRGGAATVFGLIALALAVLGSTLVRWLVLPRSDHGTSIQHR